MQVIFKKSVSIFFFLLLTVCSFAQTQKITGTVTDNKGVPLVGVTIKALSSKAIVSTNIDQENWKNFNVLANAKNEILVQIFNKQKLMYTGTMPFENTFGGVAVGKPLAYLNSLMDLSFALNQGSFADKYHIQTGNDWNVIVSWAK